jgi:spermidine synthase
MAAEVVTQTAPLTQTPLPRPAVKSSTSVWPLFVISGLGLFLELLLIRWVTTEIRIFAYLQNTVLVVCFLGLGMGCWDSRRPFALRHVLVPLTILVSLLALPPTRIYLGTSITDMLSGATGMTIWGAGDASGVTAIAGAVFGSALTLGLMYLLWATFVPVGRLIAAQMNSHPNTLAAYSANVAGSLVGIWLFVACSAAGLPPAAWVAVFAVGAAWWLGSGGQSKVGDAALLLAVLGGGVMAGYEPAWEKTAWSGYQKLSLYDFGNEPAPTMWAKAGGERRPPSMGMGTHMIGVNNIGYQATIDLRPATVLAAVARDPKQFPPEQQGLSQYDLPAKLHPNPKAALVVGAGSGNDVAGLLRNGVAKVTAVEIDAAIVTFGRAVHPEKPYDDPRVTVVIDDARSFFEAATDKFDVITFGLLDSHTTTAMTNARLDHYVYTLESLTRAKSLLAPGGVMVLSFEAQKPFIVDRMARTLAAAFGEEPLAFRVPWNGYGWGGVVFVAGDLKGVNARIAADAPTAARVAAWRADMPPRSAVAAEVATDDWPYIYLESRHVPPLYLLLAASLVVLFVIGLRQLKAPDILSGWDRSRAHFFLLGAAFMLLEVQNVSKAAVVLGNTWAVNAVIITGVLLMILAANGLAGWCRRVPTGAVVGLLVGSCLALYFLDLSRFAGLPYWQKAAAVGLLTCLPMLFSGIVFIRSFAATERKDVALGANLFGSLAGGLLQTVTFVTGIQALLLIVAGLYLLAAVVRPRLVRAAV